MNETATDQQSGRSSGAWDRTIESVSATLSHPALAWAIIAFGALVRLAQYLSNRSLWVDESYVAHNLIDKSFAELSGPLFHNQAAPLGYLYLSKLAVLAFGTSEYALRLVPLAAGLVSLYLMYRASREVLRSELVPVALLLFAASDRLIYFSSELKQYSSDMAGALAMLLVGLAALERLTPRRIAALATAGAVGLWLSHPAVFVLAGAGASLALHAAFERDRGRFGRVAIVGAVWGASFGLFYLVSLGKLTANARHQKFWNATFMPMPPFTAEGMAWLKASFLGILEDPAGLTPAWVALTMLLAGTVYALVRRWPHGALLVSPILLALLASGLRKYPFGNRLVLFLVPFLILLAVKGLELVWERAGRVGPVAALALGGLLLYAPVVTSVAALGTPRTREEIKPMLAYVAEHRRPGDVVFIYYAAQHPFQYYAARYGFDPSEVTVNRISRRNPERYLRDLDALRGHSRVWVLFSHATSKRGLDEEAYYLAYLDGMGTRLDAADAPGASVYLYDLSGATSAGAPPLDDGPAESEEDEDEP